MKRTRNLTAMTDPGHGWLSVSHKDLIELRIVDLITHCSYMNTTRVFLEEDCDTATYMEHAKVAGWTINHKVTYSDGPSKVRSYAGYNPYWVRNPIGIGSELSLADNDMKWWVCGEDKRHWRIDHVGYHGGMYRVVKSNPYTRVFPPK